MTVLLLIIVLAGCQKDQTTKPKQKTNTNDAKVVKIEKLETMSYEDFYENLKEEELNDLDIIQVADQKITAVTGNYFLVLNENKKNHTYKINKIIDLHPYGMNYYYKEESTMFYPSKDGENARLGRLRRRGARLCTPASVPTPRHTPGPKGCRRRWSSCGAHPGRPDTETAGRRWAPRPQSWQCGLFRRRCPASGWCRSCRLPGSPRSGRSVRRRRGRRPPSSPAWCGRSLLSAPAACRRGRGGR